MSFIPESLAADLAPDTSGQRAMKAAIRELRAAMKKAEAEHPQRSEMLALLADARTRIDRINAPL